MDEESAVSLALGAAKALDSVREDVAQVKEVNVRQFDLLKSKLDEVTGLLSKKPASEVEIPAEPEAQNLASSDDANWVTEVRSGVEVPETFFSDLMSFQYMQVTLSVFLLLAQFGREPLARVLRQMEVLTWCTLMTAIGPLSSIPPLFAFAAFAPAPAPLCLFETARPTRLWVSTSFPARMMPSRTLTWRSPI